LFIIHRENTFTTLIVNDGRRHFSEIQYLTQDPQHNGV